jgi:hypothetical protein
MLRKVITVQTSARCKVGMRLEAVDRIGSPSSMCPATIIKVEGEQVTVHFDGWTGDRYDYVAEIGNEDLRYVGYCEAVGRRLTPPRASGIAPVVWSGWAQYLTDIGAKAVPLSLFGGIPVVEVGMKLEAVDRKGGPSNICPATVVKVEGDDITVHFDGWDRTGDRYDYTAKLGK